MSETYIRLKEMLEKQGALSKEDIEKSIAASGEMTAEEITLLEAERHEKERSSGDTISMEQYLEASKVLDTAPEGYAPWFSYPARKAAGRKIIFGHWAALEGQCDVPGLYALDTGCVWGGSMTLLNVDSGERIACSCAGNAG